MAPMPCVERLSRSRLRFQALVNFDSRPTAAKISAKARLAYRASIRRALDRAVAGGDAAKAFGPYRA
ncbi:MAG: hypothetical protein C4334_13935 [Pyrinomonas sp.]